MMYLFIFEIAYEQHFLLRHQIEKNLLQSITDKAESIVINNVQ
ncbi:hypothetical protein MCERHM31_01227 [Methylophilaceae bacterium]|jgi:hypothetical protein